MSERIHMIVSGRVQGVYFRAHTREKALTLGLTGWVRNLPDGKVEVVAEGDKSGLEELAAWCRQGPPAACVVSVDLSREEPEGGLEPFSIRY